MCGIAGILDLKGHAVERPVLERIRACLAHRGPDDEGFHVEGNVGLGQRRLSIIDLSSGRQPMSNDACRIRQWHGLLFVSLLGSVGRPALLRFHDNREVLEIR